MIAPISVLSENHNEAEGEASTDAFGRERMPHLWLLSPLV